MGVDFVTSAGSSGLAARFGTSAGALTSVAPAASTSFTGNGWTAMMNAAYMTGLLPATAYYYQVGSDAEGWSDTFRFVNQPEAAAPPVHAVFADFGFGNDVRFFVSLCLLALQSTHAASRLRCSSPPPAATPSPRPCPAGLYERHHRRRGGWRL